MNVSPPGTSLPAPLLDLLSNPARVGLDAYVTILDGANSGRLDAKLFIAPMVDPASIPGPMGPEIPVREPSVLTTLALGIGGLLVHRLRRPGTSRQACEAALDRIRGRESISRVGKGRWAGSIRASGFPFPL